MKKIILIIISFIFISCGTDHTDFSGKWVEKKQEKTMVTIDKNGKNYLIEIEGKKFPAQLKDELLEISTQIPVKASIDNNGHLIIAGEEYIRIETSQKRKLIGNWDVVEDGSSKPSECYFFTFDLNINVDERNNIVIIGGENDNKNFKSNNKINIKNISFNEGILSGSYKYRVELGEGWDAPPMKINNEYYFIYTFYKDFIISIVDDNTLLMEYKDKKNTCPQILLNRI